jgi:Leucine-rich repeat (LRR) protein
MNRTESSFSKVCSKVYAVHLWVTNLANLRLDLETKSNEILSLKIHAANSTSLNEKSYDTKKKKQQSEPTKPKILLIGTSNIKGIDEERISAKFVTHKCTAYTFEQTFEKLDPRIDHLTVSLVDPYSN